MLKSLISAWSEGVRRERARNGRVPAASPPRDPTLLREEILAHGLSADRALELARALEGEGRLLDAIESLTVANRLCRDPAIERRLVRLRQAAFSQVDRSLPPPAWPPFVPEDPPGTPDGARVVTRAELTPAVVRNGILRHGCVLVRGLVPAARTARLRGAIDRAFDAYDSTRAGKTDLETSTWFDPLEDLPDGDVVRAWVRKGEGVLAADSPRALFEFLETVHDIGLDRLISDYLGERPSLAAEKCTLRRADAATLHPEWHQDGAFLGDGIRTVDAWFALSRCGRDAPGLDLIPLRLDRVLPTGAADADAGTFFDWVVSSETIVRELPGVQVWRPEFEAGDVLLFDHFMLHRTAASPAMRERRYAIESWFFASSVYPTASTPSAHPTISTPIVL